MKYPKYNGMLFPSLTVVDYCHSCIWVGSEFDCNQYGECILPPFGLELNGKAVFLIFYLTARWHCSQTKIVMESQKSSYTCNRLRETNHKIYQHNTYFISV